MLFKLVNNVCADIDKLPFFPAPPELAEQIQANAPDAVADITRQSKAQGKTVTQQQSAATLSLVAFTAIKSIPKAARAMSDKVNNRRVPAAQRCAIASILAYLVQPHDLIPDVAPGHYGYLDDAILIQAGLTEYLDTLPPGIDANSQQMLAAFLMGLTPQHVRPLLEQSISALSQMVQILSMIGPDAEGILQLMIANPLIQQSNVSPPHGFSPHPPRDYGGFFGQSGAYIEGNNFVMPGGGGLINGELFIP